MKEFFPKFHNPKEAFSYLKRIANGVSNADLLDIAMQPLRDPAFLRWPAASKKHHAFEGGLIVHTAQVMVTALSMIDNLIDARRDELIVAVIWHDYGKIQDYVFIPSAEGTNRPADGEYPYTSHHQGIGHLTASALEFCQYPTVQDLDQDVREFILHLILSHHGRKEWGSPVTPNCAEAWCIHAADMLSAQFTKDSHVGPRN